MPNRPRLRRAAFAALMSTYAILLPVGGAVVPLSGCTCTAVGALAGLRVDVALPPQVQGAYRIDVVTPEEVFVVEPRVGERGLACDSCRIEGGAWILDGLFIEGSTNLQLSLVDPAYTVGPASVTVRVSRDGALVDERTIQPAYERQYPNGKQCDDGRERYASQSIVVP
jgi:hypothetical protein